MSKLGQYKSYLTGVQNEGGGGRGHFWTMSKRKTFFSDGFPKPKPTNPIHFVSTSFSCDCLQVVIGAGYKEETNRVY